MPLDGGVADLVGRRVHGLNGSRLTPMECRLLGYLAARPGQTVPRSELLVEVWGYDATSRSRTVYSTVDRLRAKIERTPATPRHLLTIGRSGYRFQPPRSADRPPERLWARPLDDFVGRRTERDAVVAWVLDPDRRAQLNLHGPAGVGKTRLAREAGLEARMASLLYLDVTHCRSMADLRSALGGALGVRVGPDARDWERVGRVLVARGPALLVLDGADAIGSELSAWLAEWEPPRPKVLVLSHARLFDPQLPLGPMGTGPESDALELLFTRARGRWPRWSPDASDRQAAEQLVERLHGLPLAIELVATSAVALGPGLVLERLATQPSTEPLRACIDWSWARMTADEQHTLAAFSTFEGSFDRRVATEFADRAGVDVQVLGQLADRGAVHLLDAGEQRMRVHAAVVHHARHQLELDPTRHRAAVAAHAQTFGRHGTLEALEHLTRHGTGADYAHLAQQQPDLLAVANAGGAWSTEARQVVAYAELFHGSNDTALAHFETLCGQTDLEPANRVWANRMLGEALRRAGRLEEARAALTDAASVARAHSPQSLGAVLHGTGVLEATHGNPSLADDCFDAAIREHRANGDGFREHLSVAEQATGWIRVGQFERAEAAMKPALAGLRALGCPVSEAIYLGNLAVAQMGREQPEAARQSLLAAYEIAQRLGSRRLQVSQLSNLGYLDAKEQHLERAADWYTRAIDVAVQDGDRMGASIARGNLAALELRQGRSASARRLLDLADADFDVLQMPQHTAASRLVRSALCRQENQPNPRWVAEADALIAEGALRDLEPWTAAERGLVELASAGSVEQARAHLAKARELAARLGQGADTDAGRTVRELADALEL